MSKDYKQNAEERSIFLSPVAADGDWDERGERVNTRFLKGAKLIDIDKIKPDPNQPRKTFAKEKLDSLAASIRELGEIIDPLTVEYDRKENFFRIVSGERRYRAARMVGLERLPCIIKEVDEKRRLLLQLVANLQREDISPLEESAGIRSLMERFGYSQVKVAKMLNKSKSYISQIMGLERLSETAKEIVQASELSKEVQIQASREKDPQRQHDILRKASEEGKSVRQLRAEGKILTSDNAEKLRDSNSLKETSDEATLKDNRFREWVWKSAHGGFVVTIQFNKEQNAGKRNEVVKAALGEAYKYVRDLVYKN